MGKGPKNTIQKLSFSTYIRSIPFKMIAFAVITHTTRS
jgi:hypothetical protein